MTPPRPEHPWGAITDVPGVLVGHADRAGAGWLSGVTVVLPPPGSTGAVDVRGGGPGTHETDALDPSTLVPTVDAVVLTGGSAYGLASAGGVQRWCEEEGRGFPVGPPDDPGGLVVPIVPAAAIFDLGRGGDPSLRPDEAMGYQAAGAATGGAVPVGCRGAGTGAVMAGRALKGGLGTAAVRLDGGVVVGALVVVNAFGSPVDPGSGGLFGTAFVPRGLPRPQPPDPAEHAAAVERRGAATGPGEPSTTLAVVATNATLAPARARRTAICAHDGMARALQPVHTLLDGDTVFVLATGQREVSEPTSIMIDAAAADAVLLAIMDAVLAATGTRTPALDVPSYREVYASVVLT